GPAPGAGGRGVRGPGAVGHGTGGRGGEPGLPAHFRRVAVLDRGLPVRLLGRPVRPAADARLPAPDPTREEVPGRRRAPRAGVRGHGGGAAPAPGPAGRLTS